MLRRATQQVPGTAAVAEGPRSVLFVVEAQLEAELVGVELRLDDEED